MYKHTHPSIPPWIHTNRRPINMTRKERNQALPITPMRPRNIQCNPPILRHVSIKFPLPTPPRQPWYIKRQPPNPFMRNAVVVAVVVDVDNGECMAGVCVDGEEAG